MEVDLSTILNPFGSNGCLMSSGYVILLKVMLCQLSSCFRSRSWSGEKERLGRLSVEKVFCRTYDTKKQKALGWEDQRARRSVGNTWR